MRHCSYTHPPAPPLYGCSIFDCFSTLSSLNCLLPGQDNYPVISLPIQTSRARNIICVSVPVVCAWMSGTVCVCRVKVGIQGAERSLLWRNASLWQKVPVWCHPGSVNWQICICKRVNEFLCVHVCVLRCWNRCSKAMPASDSFPISYSN